jgi:hypothetical protein
MNVNVGIEIWIHVHTSAIQTVANQFAQNSKHDFAGGFGSGSVDENARTRSVVVFREPSPIDKSIPRAEVNRLATLTPAHLIYAWT